MEEPPRNKLLFSVGIAVIIILPGLMLWKLSSRWQPRPLGVPVSPATALVSQDVPTTLASSTPAVPTSSGFQYIEVVDGCGPYFTGACVNMRGGPGEEYPIVMRLRTGVVLKVAGSVEQGGRTWYKIMFDEGVLYPERIMGDWYVAGDYVRLFTDAGDEFQSAEVKATSTKRIVVSLSEEMLYAYDGDTLFMKEPISTGLEFTPTPRGMFTVFKKTPSRYMQGPVPGVSDQYFDLPGVPWDLYFTYEGAVIHGAYWHDHFGSPWSHGCVNLPPQKAMELYLWAPVGMPVLVQD